MPAAVADLLRAVDLRPDGVVKWGEVPNVREPGVYVVSVNKNPLDRASGGREPPIDVSAVKRLLVRRPNLLVDNMRPSVGELARRLGEFWLPDESILYIGQTGSGVRSRVKQYYATKLGARRPHAGGWFLKTLRNLDELFVHFTATATPKTCEHCLVAEFCRGVSPQTRAILRDPDHPFPFANLEWPKGTRKTHGIKGATEPRHSKG